MRQSGGGGAAAGRRVYGACASGARCAALNFFFNLRKMKKSQFICFTGAKDKY
jgi:hypothetical protein